VLFSGKDIIVTGATGDLGVAIVLRLISQGANVLALAGHQNEISRLGGSLLLPFGLAMAFALGIKAPLDFSVFSSATGAFLLSGLDRYKLSLDDRKSEAGSR
jgi:NAD(P)-dependent dehydrogenase (short-subunit alcohol dehydrogenase family)